MLSLTTTNVSASIGRNTVTTLLWVLFLLIYAAGYPNLATATQGEVKRPVAITDIDAISNESGTTLYLLDSETKLLYRHKISTDTQQVITLNDFEPFPVAQTFQNPTALNHKGNNLYICDRATQKIFEIDTEKITITEVLNRIGVDNPVSIALSGTGTIAVGDDHNDNVVTFEPLRDATNNLTGYSRKSFRQFFDEPDRLIFMGEDLFVLETDDGRFSLVNGSESSKPSQGQSSVNNLLAAIKNESKNIQDLAYLNGVFYIVSDGRVFALTPISSHKSFPIFKEKRSARLPRIVAAREHLFLKQAEGKSIWKLPRPVPVTVNFEPDSIAQPLSKTYEQQRSALLFLYEYLDKLDALPTRAFTTQRQYLNLKQLLFEQHVLIDQNYADQATEGKVISDKRLADLICKYNKSFCEQPNPLTRLVPANQDFILPNIPMESDVTLIVLPLGRKTVREALSEILIPEHREQISTEYLLRVNRSFFQTFESELALESFIPASWTGGSFKPGTVLKFENGRERIIGDLSDCSSNVDERIKKFRFEMPGSLRTTAVESFLPKRVFETAPLKFSSLNVHEAVIDAKEWTREIIDFDTLSDFVRSASTDQRCTSLQAALGSTEQLYVIQQAIRASANRYLLMRQDGSQRTLTAKDLESANLLGQPYEGKDYTLAVDDPIYYGYTLLRVDSGKPVQKWSPAVVSDVKPATKQDILNLTGGAPKLPATRWRLSLFVNATDVYDSTSTLSKALVVPGVRMLKEERIEAPRSASIALTIMFPDQSPGLPDEACEAEIKIISGNRADLLKRYGALPVIEGLSGIYIGVAENRNSVHMDHPDFAGVWYQASGLGLVPVPIPASAVPTTSQLIKPFSRDDDHGDHVAGIIAAQSNIAPGLARGVRLLLLDTSPSEATLENVIDSAITSNAKILNFSFTIGSAESPQANSVNVTLDGLADKMRTSLVWRGVLFVAASGNETKDLTTVGDRIPVKWVREISNIIGVAAADNIQNVLGERKDANGKTSPGTNYSHKFIQLLAPGLDVYSTASGAKYASATGSSQAVPQVTAAAAMVLAQDAKYTSLQVKARLIYTADWLPQYDDTDSKKRKVWGGLLNVRRAVLHPNKNLLVRKGNTKITDEWTFDPNERMTIKKGQCEVDDPNDTKIPCPDSLLFQDVLRISRQSNNLYRVTYIHSNSLRIIKDVSFEGKIPCKGLFEMDQTTFQFGIKNKCTPTIDVTDIEDYVAAIPFLTIEF